MLYRIYLNEHDTVIANGSFNVSYKPPNRAAFFMLKTNHRFTIDIDKPLQEKCGILGIFNNRHTANLPLAMVAAGGVQHRGQQGAGLVLHTRQGLKRWIGNGLLQEVFPIDRIKKLNKPNKWLLIHCRYGTHGGYDKRNLQPCMVTARDGSRITIVHNGEFVAADAIRKQIRAKFPKTISDTYLFAYLLARSTGRSWDEKITKTITEVNGAYSLIIGIKDTLYVCRDRFGLRPLVIGKMASGWIIVSETHALDKVGAVLVRSVHRGEVVRIDTQGVTVLKKGSESQGHFCDFEWAYFSRPDSLLPTNEKAEHHKPNGDWLSVGMFRARCGRQLAIESPIKKATFAVGVPDSGIAVTASYASALGIAYQQTIIRDHYDSNGNQRLFMRDDERRKIKKKVLGKLSLIPDPRVWKDAIVVIGDDSIVRGNVSAEITRAIFTLGAKEVHWIVGFPAVQHHCPLGVSIRMERELIAAKFNGDSDKIAQALGATSVRYISHQGFIKARLLSGPLQIPNDEKEIFLANGGCGGCITGHYPVTRTGQIHPHAVTN